MPFFLGFSIVPLSQSWPDDAYPAPELIHFKCLTILWHILLVQVASHCTTSGQQACCSELKTAWTYHTYRTLTRYQQVLPTGLIHLVLQCRKHDQLLQHLYDEEIKSEIGEGLMCREIFGFLATAFWWDEHIKRAHRWSVSERECPSFTSSLQ